MLKSKRRLLEYLCQFARQDPKLGWFDILVDKPHAGTVGTVGWNLEYDGRLYGDFTVANNDEGRNRAYRKLLNQIVEVRKVVSGV